MKQDELYKNRSISACLKTAYVLWSTNFTTICKRVWKPLLALSLSSVVAVEAALTVYKSAMMGQWSVGGGIALLLGLVLLLASSMWYLAAVMTLATPLGLRKCLRRSAAALGFLTGSFIVLSLLLMAVSVGFFLLAYGSHLEYGHPGCHLPGLPGTDAAFCVQSDELFQSARHPLCCRIPQTLE